MYVAPTGALHTNKPTHGTRKSRYVGRRDRGVYVRTQSKSEAGAGLEGRAHALSRPTDDARWYRPIGEWTGGSGSGYALPSLPSCRRWLPGPPSSRTILTDGRLAPRSAYEISSWWKSAQNLQCCRARRGGGPRAGPPRYTGDWGASSASMAASCSRVKSAVGPSPR